MLGDVLDSHQKNKSVFALLLSAVRILICEFYDTAGSPSVQGAGGGN